MGLCGPNTVSVCALQLEQSRMQCKLDKTNRIDIKFEMSIEFIVLDDT